MRLPAWWTPLTDVLVVVTMLVTIALAAAAVAYMVRPLPVPPPRPHRDRHRDRHAHPRAGHADAQPEGDEVKTRKFAAALLAALTLTLVGCAADKNLTTEATAPGITGMSVFRKALPDGRSLLCVYYDGGDDGGLSCDWAGAK